MSGIVGGPSGSSPDLQLAFTPEGNRATGSRPRPATTGTLLRLSVCLRRRGLDRQLAAGVDPSRAPDLQLRAWQLVQRSSRQGVARGLRRAVRDAQNYRGLNSVAPVSRQAVVQWGQGLLGVADAIEQSDRVSACGVALARELLTDCTGPLYDPGAEDRLGQAIGSIAQSLHT